MEEFVILSIPQFFQIPQNRMDNDKQVLNEILGFSSVVSKILR